LCTPDAEAAAKEAGADYVGLDEYIEKIKGGWTDIDVIITMPSIMGKIGALGRGDDKSPYVPVIAHEAMHVVLSLCKQIGYDPLNEQEPAAYAMEYLVKQALGFFALNEGASSK
jgi:hypothetical protein